MKRLITGALFVASVFSSHAHAQSWKQMQWGLNTATSPYQVGVNLAGSWYQVATLASSGAFSFAFPSYSCASSQWVSASNSGGFLCSQPSFSNISGTISASQLIAPGASTFGAVKSSAAPSNQYATGINTSGVVTYAQPAISGISGASKYADGTTGTGVNATADAYSASNQALYLAGNLTNTGTAPYAVLSINDTSASGTTGDGFIPGLFIAHNIGASAGEGSRVANQSILTIANPVTSATGNFYYIADFPRAYVSKNLGGSIGANNSRGDVYAFGALAELQSGATYVHGVTGAEIDVSVKTGASVDYKSILSVVSVNADAVGGSVFNAMQFFAADQTTSYKWPLGIGFGNPIALWPFDTSSTIMGTTAPAIGSRVANYGVDFSGVTFSTGAFKSTGFLVDGSGATTVASLTSNGSGSFTGTLSSTGATAGVVAGPRSGSGNNYQWYNPTGVGMKLTDGGSDLISLTSTGGIYAGAEISPANKTVATLPTCNSSSRGAMLTVTDGAAALGWGATVSGGGSAVYGVFCNNSNWTVYAK